MAGNKKGVSDVVATVLIILITVLAVGIVAAFLIPMVRDWLSGTGCYDVLDKVRIDEASEYTCYNPDNSEVMLTIEMGDAEITEIAVAISVGGEADVYRIKNDSASEGISMLSGNDISLPSRGGGKKTYVFDREILAGASVSASTTAVVDDKVCDVVKNVQLMRCTV